MLFNRTRALEYMRRHRLDALVATSPVNITYFTDYFNWTDALFKGYMTSPGSPPNIGQGYAVFPLEGEPALVVGPFTAVNAGEIWVRDWRLYGDSGLDFSLHDQARPASVDALYEQLRNAPHNASPTAALVEVQRQELAMPTDLWVRRAEIWVMRGLGRLDEARAMIDRAQSPKTNRERIG